MDREYLIKLTSGLYRVTDLFPQDPLKFKIRDRSADILAGLISPAGSRKNLLEDINALNTFLDLEKIQNWVDCRNILVLQREYDRIRREIGQVPENNKVEP